MEAVLGVVLTGIAAIITAAAAFVKASRWANHDVRRENRGLHDYRNRADRVIRLKDIHTDRHGLLDTPEITKAKAALLEAGRVIDNGEEPAQ